jgi:Phytanoyl-CoA dioxygenase (PhyH)
MSGGVEAATVGLVKLADAAERDGALLEAIDLLTRANREQADASLEYRLVSLRRRAFDQLDATSAFATWPPPLPRPLEGPRGVVPAVSPSELTADVLRHHITTDGCLHVRGLADAATVSSLVDGIDRALEVWCGLRRPYAKATGSPWFDPLEVDEPLRSGLGRTWVTNSGGLLTADSPRMLFRLLETLEAAGLREVVHEYLGERPALSANKCTVRRVPVDTNAGWHQDGAFLGQGIRALNVWLALSACGRDAPGLDLVPRRFDHIVETGTHGAYFDWAVGSELVSSLARETPVVRPEFAAGDALIFDDLLLHRTATEPAMTRHRHAIETWCFAPSAYPQGHVPIVW